MEGLRCFDLPSADLDHTLIRVGDSAQIWSRNDLTIDGWQLVGGVVIVVHCLWLVVVNLVGGDCCVWWC